MEKQLNSSEIFSRIFVIADSSRDPTRCEKKEHRTLRVHRPDHLHVNFSTTSIGLGKEMMRFPFRLEKISRITRTDS